MLADKSGKEKKRKTTQAAKSSSHQLREIKELSCNGLGPPRAGVQPDG